jgi:glycosyltransferase involved in cell wall biosynthesis
VLVSVVTPVYNLAHTLPAAINSLTGQTHKDLEIIIINDGSPDNAGEVAEHLARGDNRVRVIHQENKGLPASLNIGFSQAIGDPLLILSPDDTLHKSAISTMLAHMDRMGADVVNTDMLVGGRPVETRALDLDTLMHANCHGYAALFRRWLFKATGGFKTTMNPSWEDYEFWLNCAKLGAKGVRVAKPLFIYSPNPMGRGAEAQGKDRLLRGKLEGYHRDLFGDGAGLVTFVIPLYDHEKYVREAAQSALDQIYPHVEVIVVDDGSPGDPIEALAGLNVHLLQQENRGLSGARNAGVGAAISEFKSKYAVFLDADDAVDPLFVERTMGVMGRREYVYSDLKFIGDAYHDYEVRDFDCGDLYRRHLHACTFLFETNYSATVGIKTVA